MNSCALIKPLRLKDMFSTRINIFQQQVMSIGQNQSIGTMQSFPHPEMQQALSQQGKNHL